MNHWRLAVRCAVLVVAVVAARHAVAQSRDMHFLHNAQLPPGQIGATLVGTGALPQGYIQAVEFRGPTGLAVSLAQDGAFTEPLPTPLNVGLLVAPVYRLRVTGIPNMEGLEVFPTIELIGRLHPPPGCEAKFPIPVELTEEDLRLAARGNFVTRVIYVEDRDQAIPAAQTGKHIQWFDAGPGNDPLLEADQVGRPVAILRMGGRLPLDTSAPDTEFLYGSPPFEFLPPADEIMLPGQDMPLDEQVPPGNMVHPGNAPKTPATDIVTTRQEFDAQMRARAALPRREPIKR